MPSRFAVRATRQAISPLLAMSIFSNIQAQTLSSRRTRRNSRPESAKYRSHKEVGTATPSLCTSHFLLAVFGAFVSILFLPPFVGIFRSLLVDPFWLLLFLLQVSLPFP